MPDFYCTDEELLLRLRKGDEWAFEQIFKRHWHKLYLVAHAKIGSHAEAEEIVQNIFSTLWEKRNTLEVTNLTGYLYRSVRNRTINQIRDKITQHRYWEYYKQFIPTTTKNSTENVVMFDDLSDAVEVAVNRLPEKSRQVFRLNRLEGKSISEIANLLKLSEKAIEYHLTKSLKELRVHLKDFILIWLILIQ